MLVARSRSLILALVFYFAIGDLNANAITGSAGDAADVLASAGYGTDDAAVAQLMMM